MDDSRQAKANKQGGTKDEDGQELEVNFKTTVEIYEYSLASIIHDINDVVSLNLFELENQVQDQFKGEGGR